MKVGFIGLGNMGAAMAENLARAGHELVVWNRTPEKASQLAERSACVAAAGSAAEVFQRTPVVILMLANAAAIDKVLRRSTAQFAQLVSGHTVIHMGTTSPEYSSALAADIVAAGGQYIEAPVSGSRVPAKQGKLVGMLAGDRAVVDSVSALFEPLCAQTFYCGDVPQALRMKLSVNLFLITMVSGLAEATHFAQCSGLDLAVFQAIVNAGPMASSVSTMKLAKLVEQNYAVQASISDVLMNTEVIFEAARAGGIHSPLLAICRGLFGRAEQLGHGNADMAAVILALSGD